VAEKKGSEYEVTRAVKRFTISEKGGKGCWVKRTIVEMVDGLGRSEDKRKNTSRKKRVHKKTLTSIGGG